MDHSALGTLLAGNHPTITVVEKAPPPTEIVPFKIPTGFIDYFLANRYAGDRYPGEHLLYLSKLCSLFKIASISMDFFHEKSITSIIKR